MAFEFSIVGGQLRVEKSVFTQEMLFSSSLLKVLLGRQPGANISAGRPVVSLHDDDGYITINYTSGSHISLGQSPGDILKELKSKYAGGIRGRVTCKGSMYTFEVDVDNDCDKVQFVME